MRTTEERVTNLEEILAGIEREIRELIGVVSRLSRKVEGDNKLEKGSDDSFRLDRKSMNKQWAKVIGKIGSIDKDIIALEVPFLLEKYFNCEPYQSMLRAEKWTKDGESFMVNIIQVCEDKVFAIVVDSYTDQESVDQTLEKIGHFGDFFPEYKDKEIIPIYASLVFEDNVIKYASKKGLYLMAYREWEYMDIINFDKVKRNI